MMGQLQAYLLYTQACGAVHRFVRIPDAADCEWPVLIVLSHRRLQACTLLLSRQGPWLHANHWQ